MRTKECMLVLGMIYFPGKIRADMCWNVPKGDESWIHFNGGQCSFINLVYTTSSICHR